jgi:hypothetical protein
MKLKLVKTPQRRQINVETGKSVDRAIALVIVVFVLIAAHLFGLEAEVLKLIGTALG